MPVSRGPSDAELSGWHEVGTPVRETRTDFAESAQGVATDGRRWFVVSNRAIVGLMRKITDPLSILDPYRNTRRVGVYGPDGAKTHEIAPDPSIWAELVRRNKSDYPDQAVHVGAPTWTGDTLLVPTQRPSGVWVLHHDLAAQDWWADPAPVRPELWSWVDRHSETGLLYTSKHWQPGRLQALEWQSLRRVPEADIHLGSSQPKLDRVQGGAFTPGGRIVLTSSNSGGQLFCYSAHDGAFLGVQELGTYFELEGVAVQRCTVDGQRAEVHLLDAQTHYWPLVKWGDSFRVRSYAVPHPDGW